MKKHFADRLVDAIEKKGNPCMVGLDPRVDEMPRFITSKHFATDVPWEQAVCRSIVDYHQLVLQQIAGLVAAVKPQIAFYEQYGLPGIAAFVETVQMAKRMGLLVIVDAKRNDISSTAAAYANAFLGACTVHGRSWPIYDVDCITVSPYLGADSLEPFVDVCERYGKGIFVLVKTSNPGSRDLQDVIVDDFPLYIKVAKMVQRYAERQIGKSGYSSIGAVVGATFPAEAKKLRAVMPSSLFLVPGYGAQGAVGRDAAHCFNRDSLGAIVNSSRSITYEFDSLDISKTECQAIIEKRLVAMISDVKGALTEYCGAV